MTPKGRHGCQNWVIYRYIPLSACNQRNTKPGTDLPTQPIYLVPGLPLVSCSAFY